MARKIAALPGVKKVSWLIDASFYPAVQGLEEEGIQFIVEKRPRQFYVKKAISCKRDNFMLKKTLQSFVKKSSTILCKKTREFHVKKLAW